MGEYQLSEIPNCTGIVIALKRKLFIDLEGAGVSDPAIGVFQLEDIDTADQFAEVNYRLGCDVGDVFYFSAQKIEYLKRIGLVGFFSDFESDKRDGRVGIELDDLWFRVWHRTLCLAFCLGGCQ